MHRLYILTTIALLSMGTSAQAGDVRPDRRLTPGAVASTSAAEVCRAGYAARVRAGMAAGLRASVYRRYRVPRDDHGYVIDHLVPLELGGADTAENLWPEPMSGPLNSHIKDALEDLLRRRVCTQHTLSLQAAQAAFLDDWVAAWYAFGAAATGMHFPRN